MVDAIQTTRSDNVVKKSIKELRESIVSIAPIFAEKPFFMSDEFTLVDCCIAPILWRLPFLGVEIRSSKQTRSPCTRVYGYRHNRDSFPGEPDRAGGRKCACNTGWFPLP
ncbi:MAG: glutathione binding-like protein [Halioglobus sp.]